MSKQNGIIGSLHAAVPVVIAVFAAGVYAEPILISTFDDLLKIGVDAGYPLDGEYELAADIDASPSRALPGGRGFEPIGKRVAFQSGFSEVVDSTKAFRGSFDGKGHTIRGLYINRPQPESGGDGPGIGLFGFACGARISNLAVDADSVIGYRYAGAVVGRAYAGAISGCRASGAVVAEANAGGLAGGIEAQCAVTSSYATTSVSGSSDVGGLVGSSDDSRVTGCYSLGPVAARGAGQRVGGLVGYNNNYFGKVAQCYSMSAVFGAQASSVGGLVGENANGGSISASYSAGPVSGGENAGGLVGSNSGGIVNTSSSYWDTERSGLSTSAGGTGKPSVEMARGATFSGWFTAADALWAISNNYPYLKDLPFHTATFTATRGGSVGRDTAASVCAQTANHGVDLAPVAAAVSDSAGGDSFAGWYLSGNNAKLANGVYNGFTAAISDGGDTIALSGLTGDVGIEARFTMKAYTLTYVAEANGKVRADTAGAGGAADTVVFRVGHGEPGPLVRAVPNTAYRFFRWNRRDTSAVRADTAWKDSTFTATFTGDTLKLSYATSDKDMGQLRIGGVGGFNITYNVKAAYGKVGPVVTAASLHDEYRFVKWSDGDTGNPRVDTAVVDVNVTALFAVRTFALAYTAGPGGKIAVTADGGACDTLGAFVDTVEYNKSGPRVTAVPDSGYRFVKWADNNKTDSSRTDAQVKADISAAAVFEKISDAVKSADRVIPGNMRNDYLTVVRPLTTITGEFTAGPNPAARQLGTMVFFWNGRRLDNGTLFVYDVTGNVVGRISVCDNITDIRAGKRSVASWDLTDGNGKPVPDGTYLVKGTLSTGSGAKEKVSLILGVR